MAQAFRTIGLCLAAALMGTLAVTVLFLLVQAFLPVAPFWQSLTVWNVLAMIPCVVVGMVVTAALAFTSLGQYVLRRLYWSVFTILGVMICTFLLFRVVSGDVAAANLGLRAQEEVKARWRHEHGYDLPTVVNFLDRQLVIVDQTVGENPVRVGAPPDSGSNAVVALGLVLGGPKARNPETAIVDVPVKQPAKQAPAQEPSPSSSTQPATGHAQTQKTPITRPQFEGRHVFDLSDSTPVEELTGPDKLALMQMPDAKIHSPKPILTVSLSDGSSLTVDLKDVKTAGDILDRINKDPANKGRVKAKISQWSPSQLGDSQFVNHLINSILFRGRSFRDERLLTDIIRDHAPYSLALTVPALAFEFLFGLAIASVVAYFRGKAIDRLGVFLSVLGMCIPFLAFMIYGQWAMFKIAPAHAYGIFYRANIYLPISIMVVAGLGGMVLFYRTIILDETNRDYVRTARAKGVPLPTILFKHVLRNCMLPILTNLVLSIPFLIMGSLLVESYFGIPGLGDLMLTSIYSANEPVLNGLVFLTALIYTLGVLVTDLSYALFDPRIRLS